MSKPFLTDIIQEQCDKLGVWFEDLPREDLRREEVKIVKLKEKHANVESKCKDITEQIKQQERVLNDLHCKLDEWNRRIEQLQAELEQQRMACEDQRSKMINHRLDRLDRPNAPSQETNRVLDADRVLEWDQDLDAFFERKT